MLHSYHAYLQSLTNCCTATANRIPTEGTGLGDGQGLEPICAHVKLGVPFHTIADQGHETCARTWNACSFRVHSPRAMHTRLSESRVGCCWLASCHGQGSSPGRAAVPLVVKQDRSEAAQGYHHLRPSYLGPTSVTLRPTPGGPTE